MRGVRLEPEVSDALDDACERWARTDEAWEMIEWVLAHDPNKGAPLNEGGRARAFVFDGSWAHEMPTILVVYEVDADFVTILNAKFDDPTGNAGSA